MTHRFLQYGGGFAIPSLVLAELYTRVYRRSDTDSVISLIENGLLRDARILDFDSTSARQFGKLRAGLLLTGMVVNPVDLMIASDFF